jgi:hypothetical protein
VGCPEHRKRIANHVGGGPQEQDIIQVCKDVFGFTNVNFKACIYSDGLPVTLCFADSVGEFITAGIRQLLSGPDVHRCQWE